MRAGRWWFLLLALVGVGFVALTLPMLPARMATHFNLRGESDGWATRETYALFQALIGLGLPLAIVGLVARLAPTRPDLLNVPGKDYWFEPARRAEGVTRVTDGMWWLACLMLALAIGIHWLILTANLAAPPRLPGWSFAGVIAAFLLGLALWIRSLNAAMRPPQNSSP